MIKVINGTVGVFENNRMELKTSKNEPFELETKREAELVAAGIAKYCETAASPAQSPGDDKPPAPEQPPVPPVGDGKEPDPDPDPKTPALPAYDESMKFDELKAIAKVYGVDAEAMRSKAQVIAAIEASKAAAGTGEDDTDEDDNKLPDLNAADPV